MSVRSVGLQVWIGVALATGLGAGCASPNKSGDMTGAPIDVSGTGGSGLAGNGTGAGGAMSPASAGNVAGQSGAGGMNASNTSGTSGAGGTHSSAGAAGMPGTGGKSGSGGAGGTGGVNGSGGTSGTGGTSGSAGMSDSSDSGGIDFSLDAGVIPDPDPTGGNAGAGDPNGPCKDLDLLCFDIFDMFILNPECSTCNNGAGCQDCVLGQAI